MNKDLIAGALQTSIDLINNELEGVMDDNLREEFELTLAQLNLALKELKKE